jgi:hypothetical protein
MRWFMIKQASAGRGVPLRVPASGPTKSPEAPVSDVISVTITDSSRVSLLISGSASVAISPCMSDAIDVSAAEVGIDPLQAM